MTKGEEEQEDLPCPAHDQGRRHGHSLHEVQTHVLHEVRSEHV